MSHPNTVVHTLHWNNIDRDILAAQRAVFEKFGIPLEQHCLHQKKHGEWMTELVAAAADDAVLVFADIDAFPLNRQAYEDAVEFARQGGVFGLAQFSNHLEQHNALYAGPMFMAFRKDLWKQLGQPGLTANDQVDAAEILTVLARRHGAPVRLVPPVACIRSRWALGNEGVFGIGTFYGQLDYFHLFQSRKKSSIALMKRVAADVVADRPLDFAGYLQLFDREENQRSLAGLLKYCSELWRTWRGRGIG